MKKIWTKLPLLFTAVYMMSCAPSRFVEPLKKNELTLGGNFGGPVIEFGAPVPIPLTSVEVGYGVSDRLTAFGGLHTTAALFGNLQLDAGITYQVLKQSNWIPSVSLSPSVNFITNFGEGETKLWPIVDANAFWNYGKRQNYFYVGVNNYFELSSTTALDQPHPQNWLFNPQLGHVVKSKNNHWQLTTEIKFLAPNLDNSYAFVPYKSLMGSRGATAIFIGCRWSLNHKKNP